MSKYYHLRFYPKLGHGICAIFRIPCAYVGCTSILDKPWISGIPSNKQARYQPVTNCTYWTVLGSYNNWIIIELKPKSLTFEAFDEIHQVVLDGLSEHRDSLFSSGIYGAINTNDTTGNGLYGIQLIS